MAYQSKRRNTLQHKQDCVLSSLKKWPKLILQCFYCINLLRSSIAICWYTFYKKMSITIEEIMFFGLFSKCLELTWTSFTLKMT